jgi:hypothetical protein
MCGDSLSSRVHSARYVRSRSNHFGTLDAMPKRSSKSNATRNKPGHQRTSPLPFGPPSERTVGPLSHQNGLPDAFQNLLLDHLQKLSVHLQNGLLDHLQTLSDHLQNKLLNESPLEISGPPSERTPGRPSEFTDTLKISDHRTEQILEKPTNHCRPRDPQAPVHRLYSYFHLEKAY